MHGNNITPETSKIEQKKLSWCYLHYTCVYVAGTPVRYDHRQVSYVLLFTSFIIKKSITTPLHASLHKTHRVTRRTWNKNDSLLKS